MRMDIQGFDQRRRRQSCSDFSFLFFFFFILPFFPLHYTTSRQPSIQSFSSFSSSSSRAARSRSPPLPPARSRCQLFGAAVAFRGKQKNHHIFATMILSHTPTHSLSPFHSKRSSRSPSPRHIQSRPTTQTSRRLLPNLPEN